MTNHLYQLIYSSTFQAGRIDSTIQALRDIVQASIRNNAHVDVTGFLIFDGNTFLQILEGKRADVLATYERIARDGRHRGTRTLFSRNVEKRDFSAWRMGGVLRTDPVPAFSEADQAVAFAKRSMSVDTPIR